MANQIDKRMNRLDFRKKVEKRLQMTYEFEAKEAPSDQLAELLNKMKNLSLSGGKRFRSYLAFIMYIAYGGKNIDELIEVAISSELLHNYALVHDDLLDDDLTRYGVQNITGQYLYEFESIKNNKDRERLASGMALLAGDLGISLVYKQILSIKNLDNQKRIEMLKLLTESNVAIVAGQQLDTLNINLLAFNFTMKRLIKTDLLKSSSYTTILPMNLAAILLDIDQDERNRIDKFAQPLGIFYQLVDDFSDYFANETEFNKKPKYRDYKQGKITHPYFLALKLAKGSNLKILKDNFGNKNCSDARLKNVTKIIDKCGAKEKSFKYIQGYAKEAELSLDMLSISDFSKRQLKRLICDLNPLLK